MLYFFLLLLGFFALLLGSFFHFLGIWPLIILSNKVADKPLQIFESLKMFLICSDSQTMCFSCRGNSVWHDSPTSSQCAVINQILIAFWLIYSSSRFFSSVFMFWSFTYRSFFSSFSLICSSFNMKTSVFLPFSDILKNVETCVYTFVSLLYTFIMLWPNFTSY